MNLHKAIYVLVFAILSVPAMVFSDNTLGLKPVDIIKNSTKQIFSILEQDNLSYTDKYQRIQSIMHQYVDMKRICGLVLGSRWRRLTTEQKYRFIDAFQHTLISKYIELLSVHANEYIEYLKPRIGKNSTRAEVRTIISEISGNESIEVSYHLHLHKNSKEWKIYNVKIDSLSLIRSYKDYFNYKLKKHNINYIINSMEESALHHK